MSRTQHEILSQNESSTTNASKILEASALKPSKLVWQVTCTASLSGLLFGYDTGYIGSVLVNIGTDLGHVLSNWQMELISGATSIGALLSCLFAGVLVDKVGRKVTVIVCAMMFIFGALFQSFAHRVGSMVLGRLIMGSGVGIGSLCSPLYISELSPGKFRGSLIVINCLAITGGQLLAYGIGYSFTGVNNGWRYIVGLSILPSLVQLLIIFKLPDTPRYLIMTGKLNESRYVLREIFPEANDEMINMYIEELSLDNQDWSNEDGVIDRYRNTLSQILASKANVRALIIACSLQLIQQFSGFNALMYFSSVIFKMVGYQNSTLISCFIAGTNFITTCFSLVVIDKIGRRKILLWSLPCMLGSQLICALAFSHIDTTSDAIGYWNWLLVYAMIGFVGCYAIGIGNVPWQQSELFSQSVRGLGSSISTLCNWSGSMTISLSFLTMMDVFSPSGTFLIFGMITLISWVFIGLTYPELGGLSLEEVEEVLNKETFYDSIQFSFELQSERRVIWERSFHNSNISEV